ncbi:DDE-type integrase/transposase/recombinase [Cupriavidus sp. USMAHM13]|uniref:DDE-type integrase/transposase/recombinase n=1 Tax=Cupriavidus sp. USMAHM13 TaxID=1389192 RepID=UPI0009F3DE86|nr:DDE-type integrase/transposase/recombinase [Cupriavidus sp. USMAHM13]
MHRFIIGKGLLIQKDGDLFEYVSRCDSTLYFRSPIHDQVLDITEANFWEAVATGSITVKKAVATDKELRFDGGPAKDASLSLVHFSKKVQRSVLRKLAYIFGLRELGISRGKLTQIADAAKRIAGTIGDAKVPGTSTISAWMKTFEDAGDEPVSLAPESVARSRHATDGVHEALVQEAITEGYCKLHRPTIKTAYGRYRKSLEVHNSNELTRGAPARRPISKRTFERRIKDRPAYDVHEARYGAESARAKFKHIKSVANASMIFDCAEIDHTILNLMVIDDRLLVPLGRPWITVVRDVRSGVVLGFYITFNAPSLRSLFGAIKNSLQPHPDVRGCFPGIRNPWSTWGSCASYRVDRGGDLLSESARIAMVELGARYVYAPARHPWAKGSIERFFGTLELTLLDDLPGRTFRNFWERGEYDPRQTAVVRFSTLIYLMHKWIADYVHVQPHSRKLRSPLDIWNAEIDSVDRVGIADTHKLDAVFGHHKTAPLTRRGIAFESLQYASAETETLFNTHGKGLKVDYIVPPEDIGHVHLIHPEKKAYVRIPCTRLDYANGLSLFQHKLLKKYARMRSAERYAIADFIEVHHELREAVSKDIQHLDRMGIRDLTTLARMADINSASVYEGKAATILSCTNVPLLSSGDSLQDAPNHTGASPDAQDSEDAHSVPSYSWSRE